MGEPEWYNDPIIVDNVCYGMTIAPIPELIDGWHRLFAHVVKKDETIRVSYSGRMDLLRYLQGRRKTAPEW